MPVLNWIGKETIVNHHKNIPYCVLNHKYSYDSAGQHEEKNDSENMIIHGDNLYALKSLLPSFQNRIKCIYIDPPYNTGNKDWCYNDNVDSPLFQKWLKETLSKDENDRNIDPDDLTRHDKWLCMMYPRLRLMQQLLSDDGAIFISIDDNEINNLKLLCDEIFGSRNYIATITVVVKTEGRRYGAFAKSHEYILVYAKNIALTQLNEIQVEGSDYRYYDDQGGFNLKGLRNRNVRAFNSKNRPNLRYPFYVDVNSIDKDNFMRISTTPQPGYKEVWASTVDGLESVWRWGIETATKHISELTAQLGTNNEIRIFQKERKLTQTPKTVWTDKQFNSIVGTRELDAIFKDKNEDFVFPHPKPLSLIQQILTIGADSDSIVLDSFSGSGTTAHALLLNNLIDEGNRKFILIEMMNYADTITAERIKRVIDGYDDKEGITSSFSYYELGEPLLNDGLINENIDIDLIRQYVFYSETKNSNPCCSEEGYYLGVSDSTAYYFCYEKENIVALDNALLNTIKPGFDNYVIYADVCYIPDAYLKEHNIVFKKIPRDLRRF